MNPPTGGWTGSGKQETHGRITIKENPGVRTKGAQAIPQLLK